MESESEHQEVPKKMTQWKLAEHWISSKRTGI
jgi:hypothetical protein